MNDALDRDPTAPAGEVSPSGDPEQVMDLLADHVPLALIMDLLTPQGPASADILAAEGMPDDAWWEPDAEDPAHGADDDPADADASADDATLAGA